MTSHYEWKQSAYPLRFDDEIKKILRSNIIYGFKRDKCFRPIIIVNCKSILNNSDKIDLIVQASNFFMDHVVQKAMVPGKVENWTTIFNLDDIGLTQLGSKNIQ